MTGDTVTNDIPAAIPAVFPAVIGPYRNRVVGLRVMPAGDYWTG